MAKVDDSPTPPVLGQTVYVVPTTDPAVRHPGDGQRLPAVGRFVNWVEYWARRLADGDVSVAKAPAELVAAAPAPPPAASDQKKDAV